jgi:hypothetical protein
MDIKLSLEFIKVILKNIASMWLRGLHESFFIKVSCTSDGGSPYGTVYSVNGKTGTVVLTAEDVGADSLGSAQAVQEQVDALSAEVDLKANTDDVNAALALKANSADVDAQFTSLSSAVSAKANKAYVDQQDELLQDQIDLKANAQSVNQALSLKADLVDGKVPASQLPFVDDVLEGTYINPTTFNDLNNQPYVPESGKIYVDTTSNKTYRWSGMLYVVISSGGVALGETSETAYRGDRGKIAYDHSQSQGNPHNSTTSDITEGTRLYFTEPRVRSTVLTGLVLQNAPVTETDDIVTAHGKFQGQLNNKTSLALGNTSTTALAGNSTSAVAEGSNLYFTEARVRATPLTGLSTATGGLISASDTVLASLGKLQNQVSAASGSVTWVDITTIAGTTLYTGLNLTNTKIELAKINGFLWLRGFYTSGTGGVTTTGEIFRITASTWFVNTSLYVCQQSRCQRMTLPVSASVNQHKLQQITFHTQG